MGTRYTIEEIFNGAMTIPDVSERNRYLQNACGGDQATTDEVLRLLSLVPQLGQFLETPAQWSTGVDAGLSPTDGQLMIDECVGPFRIQSLIAHGGMGSVYLARQESPVERFVAIKVVRGGLNQCEILDRFDHERRILGLMDHPNIARFLDAGMTSRGDPWFAMEWVEGEAINRFCENKGLTTRQRLELLITVCHAVHHAHQKGIIHRDLKPSNILVADREGKHVPKVIDFGIAKATSVAGLKDDYHTGFGQIMGTVEYIAPEQADRANPDIDVRADVYSLGVVAYELLTGSTPFALADRQHPGLAERLRIIQEVEPERPGMRWANSDAAKKLESEDGSRFKLAGRKIESDLDWIILKCLEKDRTRRFETVSALTQDLERYLAGNTVLACPPTWQYRFRKFSRKHRSVLVTAATLGLLLVATSIVSLVLAFQASHNHRASLQNLGEAQINLQLAIRAVDQFCTKVSEDLQLQSDDLLPLRKELLSSAAEFHQQLLRRRGGSSLAQEDLFMARRRLAKLSKVIDSGQVAIENYRVALREFDGLPKELSDLPEMQTELAECWQELSHLLLNDAQSARAMESASRSVDVCRHLLVTDPESIPVQRVLAESLLLQSAIAYSIKDLEQADKLIRDAIGQWERLVSREPDHSGHLAQLAYSHDRLGKSVLSRSISAWRDAETEFTIACDLARKAVACSDAGVFPRQVLAESLQDLGKVAKVTGRSELASQLLLEAVEELEALCRQYPSVIVHTTGLARCLHELSSISTLANDPGQAIEYLERCCKLLEPLVARRAGGSQAEVLLAEALGKRGELVFDGGDQAAGLGMLDRAVTLINELLEREPESRIKTELAPFVWRTRARLLRKLERPIDAASDYELAITHVNGNYRLQFSIERAGCLVEAKHYQSALEVLEGITEFTESKGPPHVLNNQLVEAARLCAIAGAEHGGPGMAHEPGANEYRKDFCDLAIRFLQRIRNADPARFEKLIQEPEFQELASREEFKILSRQQ